MKRVAVIGGGVAGLVAAVEFAERGCAVEVLERAPELGRGSCSWVAGGMLAPWCEGADAEPLVVRLGQESLGWWAERFPGAERNGTLVVALDRDVAELDRFARRTERFERVGDARISELEPDLGGRFARALYFPDEGSVDPRKALPALIERLGMSGAAVRFGVEADPRRLDADIVVDCRGFAAREGWKELRGVKGEMLLIRSDDVSLRRPVRLLHPRHPLYVASRGGGLHMIGATMIESEDRRVSARSVLELLSAAYALNPAFGEAEVVEFACDLRPAFPDNLPRIRRQGAVVSINGLFRHGYLLSPALARIAADAVLEGRYDPEFFHEDRRERRIA